MDVKEESTGARTSLEFYCFGPERWWENDAISYMYVRACSVMSDCCDPWTVARQAPLSMELPRQEYWSGLSLPTPGDLPDTLNCPRNVFCLSFCAFLGGLEQNIRATAHGRGRKRERLSLISNRKVHAQASESSQGLSGPRGIHHGSGAHR